MRNPTWGPRNKQLAAIRGIKFPATQVPSSDANTLDDYQESKAWTPTDASGAALSLTVSGRYTKIAGLVIAWGVVTYPATASGASALLGGLPFTVANVNAFGGGGMISTTTESTLVRAQAIPNTQTLNLLNNVGNSVTNATMSGDAVAFCVIYMV